VYQHLSSAVVPRQAATIDHRFDSGIFGVTLFFLVSGYIVPASLERRGDVRAFWIGRFFRLYPLYLVVLAVVLLALPAAHSGAGAGVYQHSLRAAVANGLMLQDLLGSGGTVLAVTWTLSYEMVFYYFVTALFLRGWHLHSGRIAAGFAAAALLVGAAMPLGMLSTGTTATQRLIAAAAATVVVALTCLAVGRPATIRVGALLLAALGLVLITTDSRSAGFETMMIFATMFSGTLIHRAQHAVTQWRQALPLCGFVVAAGIVSAQLCSSNDFPRTWTYTPLAWCTGFAAAWTVFAVGLLLRDRTFPRILIWLGSVSYAVYLIHRPLIDVMTWLFQVYGRPHGFLALGAWAALFTAVLLALGWIAHRFVELPAQRWGRNVLAARNQTSPDRDA
jgi:peptidoglycan/LPS O-acetylase OafA/YrhL